MIYFDVDRQSQSLVNIMISILFKGHIIVFSFLNVIPHAPIEIGKLLPQDQLQWPCSRYLDVSFNCTLTL